jgi:plastocyanin
MMKYTLLPVALAAGVALAGCKKVDNEQPQTAAAPPEPNTVTLTASDFAYNTPDTIPAGVTTFRLVNSSSTEAHHAFLVKLNEGKTIQDFSAAMNNESAPVPAWAVFVGGPNAADPGSTIASTIAVDTGNYVYFCVIPGADGIPHVAKGMVKGLTVVPATGPTAPEPTADITMELHDYGFRATPAITAGRHTIKFTNAAAQNHEVVLVKLEPGMTIQDWLAAAEKMQGPLPGKLMSGISGLSPGRSGYITADFTPGEYGLVCFVPDSKDGKPHFLHGMVTQVTVS